MVKWHLKCHPRAVNVLVLPPATCLIQASMLFSCASKKLASPIALANVNAPYKREMNSAPKARGFDRCKVKSQDFVDGQFRV